MKETTGTPQPIYLSDFSTVRIADQSVDEIVNRLLHDITDERKYIPKYVVSDKDTRIFLLYLSEHLYGTVRAVVESPMSYFGSEPEDTPGS